MLETALDPEDSPITEPTDVARRIVDLLADRQAEEIVLLDVRHVASFTDYFVIATAINPRQTKAIVESLRRTLRDDGLRARHQEGALDSGWVLLDYGDVIVHIFSSEQRAFYALEELWQEAKRVVQIQ